MQHRTLLNVWLILLVHYGQTDDICGAGKIRRGDKCCLSEICENTGFAECTVNNAKDTCLPCIKGFYLIGKYETSNFPDPIVCVPIRECYPEEVRNAEGECICDVSRNYFSKDEGICDLNLEWCTLAGSQLSQNGNCDPCPEGYFKPGSGKERCRTKSNITCSSTEIILEGNTTTDRKCVKNDIIASTSTYSPPLSTYFNITNDVIDRNGNDTILKWVSNAVVVFVIVLTFVVVVIQLVYHRRLRQRQQAQDLENHEHDEYVPLQTVNGELPIDDLENHENTVHVSLQPMDGALPIVDDDNIDIGHICAQVPYQIPQGNITNDLENHENAELTPLNPIVDDDFLHIELEAVINLFPIENMQYVMAEPYYESSEDSIPNDDDNIDNSHTYVKVPYQSPQDNIPNENHENTEDVPLQPMNGALPIVDLENHENTEDVPVQPMNGALPIVDDDTVDIGVDPYPSPQDNIPNDDDNFENEADLSQFPEDNIPNDDDTVDIGANLYPSPQDNIPNDDDNFENEANLYQFPQDNIPNDDDKFDNDNTYAKVPYQTLQDNIPNDDDTVDIGADPYPSPQDNIPNAVRGDMPSGEYNSNQDNDPINPQPRDDMLCQGAVGGDIDDNDKASSISNEKHVNLLHDQPEHNSQPGRMVVGLQSFDFPVQNPLLPHYHDGSSDEGDSGFQA